MPGFSKVGGILIALSGCAASAQSLNVEPFVKPTGVVGEIVSIQLQGSGGTPPYSFELTDPFGQTSHYYSISRDGLLSANADALDGGLGNNGTGSDTGQILTINDSTGASTTIGYLHYAYITIPSARTTQWNYRPTSKKYWSEVSFYPYQGVLQGNNNFSLLNLSLPPGVRIQYTDGVTFIFESDSPNQFKADFSYTLATSPTPRTGTVSYTFINPNIESIAPTAPKSVPSLGWLALIGTSALLVVAACARFTGKAKSSH